MIIERAPTSTTIASDGRTTRQNSSSVSFESTVFSTKIGSFEGRFRPFMRVRIWQPPSPFGPASGDQKKGPKRSAAASAYPPGVCWRRAWTSLNPPGRVSWPFWQNEPKIAYLKQWELAEGTAPDSDPAHGCSRRPWPRGGAGAE